MNKTIELTKQNTNEKKNKKNPIPGALTKTKEHLTIKEEPIHRTEEFGARPKCSLTVNNKTTRNGPCKYCNASNGAQCTSALHRSQIVTIAVRKDTMQGHADKKLTTNSEKANRE